MSDSLFYNFQQVLDAVYPRIDELVHHLLPEARKQGGSYRCGDSSGGKGSSFSISTRPNNAGCFIDHSDPSVKGNAIGLWATVKGCAYDEAGRELAKFLGVQPEQRMHVPKKRPVPKLNQAERTFEAAGQIHRIEPLSRRSVEFALSRGITQETLRKAKCASSGNNIVFPHFDEEENLVLIKCWPTDGTKNMFTNTDPVPVLFGKHLCDPLKTGSTLIITEGQWDALTWIQLGYPAVSIPSGANNHDWIGEDYNFLNRFSQIFLDYDDDQVGREAEAAVRTRLGIERCRTLRYRHKDANDALVAGEGHLLEEALESARNAPIERIVRPEEMRDKVKSRGQGKHLKDGVPFFLHELDIAFRPHEITIWFGETKHGKSSLLYQQIAFAASRGEKCLVASFEQPVDKTILDMLIQYTGDPDIADSDTYQEAYDDLCSKVLFYDSMIRTKPSEMIATVRMGYRALGITQVVIDNVMTLEVDRQDNAQQAETADLVRVLASQLPIHTHIVCHIRKPKDNNPKPPGLYDIMGVMEWSAMAYNIIAIWRDVIKHEKIAAMRDDGASEVDINTYDKMLPDGKVLVRAQRETGSLPLLSYFYETSTKRAWKNPDDLTPLWFPEEIENEADKPPPDPFH